MAWEGEKELKHALKEVEASKGKSQSRVRAVSDVALKYSREYKRVVHAIEYAIWKVKPDYRLGGLYSMDSVMRQSRSKNGSKDQFVKRFRLHLTETISAIKEIPNQDQVRRIIVDWKRKGFFTKDELLESGAHEYFADENDKPAGESKDKFASLLSMLKKTTEDTSDRSRNDDTRRREETQYYADDRSRESRRHSSRFEPPPRPSDHDRYGPPPTDRNPPDNEICMNFQRGRCQRGDTCRYRHEELQGNARQDLISRSRNDDRLRKTKMCANLQKGNCRFGDRCHFAHDERELVPFDKVVGQLSPRQNRGPPPPQFDHYGPPPVTRPDYPQRPPVYGAPPPRQDHYGPPPTQSGLLERPPVVRRQESPPSRRQPEREEEEEEVKAPVVEAQFTLQYDDSDSEEEDDPPSKRLRTDE